MLALDDLRRSDAFQLWCQLSEDEYRMTLEALCWKAASRSVKKQAVEALGYKPPKPENL